MNDRERKKHIEAARAALRGPIKRIEKMAKKNPEMQPDLGYYDAEGKLRDDGLHDEMLNSKAGNAASQKAAVEAAIKSGLSKAEAERFYGRLKAQKDAHEKNAQKARGRFGRSRRSV